MYPHQLVGDALRDIEIAHALLTASRFEEPAGDMRTDITFDKQTAAGFVPGERTLRDVVLYIDEGERVPFMDTSLDFGRLAWELAEADRRPGADDPARRHRECVRGHPGRGAVPGSARVA